MNNKIVIKRDSDIMQVQAILLSLAREIQDGKTFDIEIKDHQEKRSLNANAYSWKLQGEIAKVLNRRLDDVHFEMVMQYGVVEIVSIKSEHFESASRVFDYVKVLGKSKLNGVEFTHCKVGIGTHTYTTKEMAKFIDGIIAECKDLGIETLDEIRLKEMVERWKV